MKILITSGGCKVPIDDVRHIGNFSSGRFGKELAEAFLNRGHEVIFFHENGSLRPYSDENGEPYEKAKLFSYKFYEDYLGVKELISKENPDVIISAAAISDYIVDKKEGKISSKSEELTLTLKKGEKVISQFRSLAPQALVIGFKLLVGPTEEEINSAVNKVFASGVDMVIYNDLLELRKGNAQRRIYLKSKEGEAGKGFFSWGIGTLVGQIELYKNEYSIRSNG